MSTRSLTYQQSAFKRYDSDKHCQSFYLQDGGKNQLIIIIMFVYWRLSNATNTEQWHNIIAQL